MNEEMTMNSVEETKLRAGKRFLLESEDAYVEIVSGSVEAYAVTKGDVSFRRTFLAAFEEGEAVFPAMDEFEQIDVQLYVMEDAVLRVVPFGNKTAEELLPLMKAWLSRLVELPWMRIIADQGDDILQKWRQGTALKEDGSKDDLLDSFRDNEGIFAMLLGVHFGAEDGRLSQRLEVLKKSKAMLLENGVRSLLGEEPLYGNAGAVIKKAAEDATFVVQHVAKALSMPTEAIHLSADTASHLDAPTILRRLVQKGNMQMRRVTLPEDWYKNDGGVMIAYWTPQGAKDKILMALVPETPESYRAYAPNRSEGFEVTESIAKEIDPEAFLCYAGFPARALKMWDLVKFMFFQCWKADYRTILLCSVFAGMIPLATPIITETIFQDIIPILDRQGLATVTQALMVTSFTTAALSIVRSIAVMRISTHIEIAAEAAMWGRLLTMPTKFFRKFTTGELASRMGGIGIAKSLASGGFVDSVFSFLFSFWSIFLMCYYSFKLTAAAIAVWIVYSAFQAAVLKRTLDFQRKIIDSSNKTAGVIQQIFAGLAKFRVQGAEEQAYSLWTTNFGRSWNLGLQLRWQQNYVGMISSLQPFVLTLILYWIAIYGMGEEGGRQGITYAQFLAFNSAYSSFNGVMGGFLGFISQYFALQPQIENLRPLLEETPESSGDRQDAGKLTGQLAVNHLSFAYPDPQTGEPGPEVLHDVSFSVMAGENVAIVGRSGCGKSTLVRLLLGFEDPKGGSVTFDGQDLADLSLPSVRSQMGVVLQNGQLMTGDIYSNIIGTRLLSQEDAWEAAEAAGIADDIAMMPMGMQTVISEGSSNISGGQRQRLLIARALVAKPAILIFDEATSALDNRSQAIVTKSLDELKATRIIVAHRLSTIRGCDRIIVMDAGRVAEMGSFDELMEKDGLFASLVRRQVA